MAFVKINNILINNGRLLVIEHREPQNNGQPPEEHFLVPIDTGQKTDSFA